MHVTRRDYGAIPPGQNRISGGKSPFFPVSWVRSARHSLIAIGVLVGLNVTSCFAEVSNDVLIFAFFRANGPGGLYLAQSADGLKFTPLNKDQVVLKPGSWPEQDILRDPSVTYHEGTFHAVWTTGGKGACFGYARSKDLVTWSDPIQAFPFAEKQVPKNIWAPEICWDPIENNLMIFWASVLPKIKQKIYVTRTTDGKNFTPAKLFVNPSFSCIDSMLVFDEATKGESRWVMVYKNEDKPEDGGKGLLIATAPANFSKPWATNPTPIIGNGSPIRPTAMAEGGSLLKTADGWQLYWDSPLEHTYHTATSPDLKTWTDRTDELRMPRGIRHGTVFRAPRAAIGWLKKTNNGPTP